MNVQKKRAVAIVAVVFLVAVFLRVGILDGSQYDTSLDLLLSVPNGYSLMLAISAWGSPVTTTALILAMYIYIPSKQKKLVTEYALYAVILYLAVVFMKLVSGADRPAGAQVYAGYSFPSLHAALAYFNVYILMDIWGSRRAKRIIAMVTSLFVGYTRIELGAHYIIDVIGGLSLAYAVLEICKKSHYKKN